MLIALILRVDKSIGSLQAFEGRANWAVSAKGAVAVEVEGIEGAEGAKAKREKSCWTTCRNCKYLVRSFSCAAKQFLIVANRLYQKAAILQSFDYCRGANLSQKKTLQERYQETKQ
jgi:hypothetical protein